MAAKDAAQGSVSGPIPAVTPQRKIIPAASPMITPSQRTPTPSSKSSSEIATPSSSKVRNLQYDYRFYHPNGLVKCLTFFHYLVLVIAAPQVCTFSPQLKSSGWLHWLTAAFEGCVK